MNIHNSIQKIRIRRELQEERYAKIKSFVALAAMLFIGIFIGNIFTQNTNFSITGLVTGNLPDVGDSNWGTILNNYLLQEHTTTGAHGNVSVSGDLNVTGNVNVTGNLTIGDKITFRLGEVIDNLVNGFIRVTGSLNVTNDINVVGDLNVAGRIIADNLTDSSGGLISIPSGAIMFFNTTSCPTGWNEMQEAVGRYFVAINTSGTLGAVAGTALTNQENRTVGQHNHAITDPGHMHTTDVNRITAIFIGSQIASGTNLVADDAIINTNTTGITINNTGSVAGTNAPYIQILVCVKT